MQREREDFARERIGLEIVADASWMEQAAIDVDAEQHAERLIIDARASLGMLTDLLNGFDLTQAADRNPGQCEAGIAVLKRAIALGEALDKEIDSEVEGRMGAAERAGVRWAA